MLLVFDLSLLRTGEIFELMDLMALELILIADFGVTCPDFYLVTLALA